jgi:predicted transcriptional regulator
MARKRGKLEIIYAILCIIRDNKNSIKPTPLIRRSNLSSERFQEYYSELIEKGFVRELNDDGKLITLTDKGFNYLERYKTITSFIDDFGL